MVVSVACEVFELRSSRTLRTALAIPKYLAPAHSLGLRSFGYLCGSNIAPCFCK